MDKSLLFEPVKDGYGNRLALVFGNELGKCPFSKQCNHCDIGAGEGIQFNYELNKQRLEFFKQHYDGVLQEIEHLVIYNSGSVLNRKEMSKKTLKEILTYVSSLEKCKVVSFDSREMFVTDGNLEYILENLRDDQQARIILGIESQSDKIRIGKLNKLMTKENIEKVFEKVSKHDGIEIDVNVVFQPPGLLDKEAIEEAVKTAEYVLDLSEKYDVSIDLNFHPFYQTKKSKDKYPEHPRANLEDSINALTMIKDLIDKRKSNTKIFVGLEDEEHDREQDKRKRELDRYKEKFDKFNRI